MVSTTNMTQEQARRLVEQASSSKRQGGLSSAEAKPQPCRLITVVGGINYYKISSGEEWMSITRKEALMLIERLARALQER